MYDKVIQWLAVIIAFIGLVFIAVELYMPKFSESLKAFFEQTKPNFMRSPYKWIGSYVVLWVASVVIFYAWDESTILFTNIFFSVITTVALIVLGVSRVLVRLGVVLGRGNSVGGVGLVLALIGFSIEIWQLL